MNAPVYTAIGHPNEGKSSVISTLTENETIPISPTPGETVVCTPYTLEVEGEKVLELIDTPGFQNPAATLQWMQAWQGPETELLSAFLEAHATQPAFHHDCELLGPLTDTSGILYIVDASRPVREVDRQEMEILRLTGRPRMALLNAKSGETTYLNDWKEAFARRFNLVREFNAHRAGFPERVALLETLAQLTPEYGARLKQLRTLLEQEWERRAEEAALVLESLWLRTVRHQVRIPIDRSRDEAVQVEEAGKRYREDLQKFEGKARRDWRALYLHRSLPPGGPTEELIAEELFAEKVWRMLGLSRRQIAVGAAMTGAGVGAGIDVAAGGITFGVFTAAGALAGGIGSWLGVPKLGTKKLPFPGRRTWSRQHIEIGPFADPQLLFVLLDRAVLYLHRLMDWSHARQDTESFLEALTSEERLSTSWSDADRSVALQWIKTHRTSGHSKAEASSRAFRELIQRKLLRQ